MIERIGSIGFQGLLICFLPLIHQVISLYNLSANLMYVPLLIIALLNIRRLFLPSYYMWFCGAFAISYAMCTMLSGSITVYGAIYITLIAIYIFVIPTMGKLIAKDFDLSIKLLAIFSGILLIVQIIPSLGFINASQIRSALNLIESESLRDRLTYGFPHPNTAAFMISTEILLLNMTLSQNVNKKQKVFIIATILFMVVALLGTGSRTAVVSVIGLIAVQSVMAISGLFRKAKPLLYIVAACTLIYLLLSTDIIGILLNNSSGRNRALPILISALMSNDRILFGTGVAGISSGNISATLGRQIVIDSWYMHVFASTGIVGFIVIIAGIILLFYHMLLSAKDEQTKNAMFKVMFFLLCYGFAENVVLVPGVILSVVCWTLIFASYNKDVEGL